MLWNAQCRFLKAERSGASGDLMPCSRAFRQSSCFPARTRSLHFNKQSVPEEKIPVSADTGSGLASFYFFMFCKLLPKQQGTQNPHERHQQQHSRGSQVFFTSTAHLEALLTTNLPLETPKKNDSISSLFSIRQMFTFSWRRTSSRFVNCDWCLLGAEPEPLWRFNTATNLH